MTDAEWNAWQSSWTGATGPLPDVRARARKEVRSHRLANVAFFALVAVALAAFVTTLGNSEPGVPAIRWMVVLFLATMSIGYVASQRGVAAERTGNPRDALAFLERRLRVERRMAHVVRWAYAAMFAAFVVIFPILVAPHERPALEMAISYPWMALVLLATFSAPWWVERRNRRYQQEIEQWRRWMDEQQL
jgi:hypothetical protein